MAHALILGQTESGKTTLAKKLTQSLKARGFGILVLDPLHDPGWTCDFQTDNQALFMQVAKNSRSCFLFVDESGEVVGQFERENHWLATRARHWGHSSFFISQRITQVAVTVRDQCNFLYLFRCSRKDAQLLADEWAREELAEAHTLEQGQYIYAPRFGRGGKRRVF